MRERTWMKSLVRKLALWVGIALLTSMGMSLLLALGARLPRIGPVPFAAACERANTLALGVRVFVIVLTLGAARAVFYELRRRAFGDPMGPTPGTASTGKHPRD